jgi:xylulokinase
MACALGIDLGTSSTKAVLLDEEGQIRGRGSAGYPLYKPQPGWVEQEPEEWWQALGQAVRQALAQGGIAGGEIRGVGLAGQLNGAVFLDGRGRVLRPAPLWLDHRSQAECDWGNERAGEFLREDALLRLAPVNMLAKVLWVQRHEPEVYARARTVLLPKDWLRYRFTGTLGSDVSDASVTAAFDLYERDWSGEILEALELNRDLFPPVADSPDVIGEVTGKAAAQTGLAAGTRVVAGGGDMPCMILGSGVIKPGVVSLGIGTAAHATAFAEELDERAFNRLWPMCHTLPGKYAWLGCSFTGGASLAWFREQFGGTYEELTAEAEKAPAGAEGLFFAPWLEGCATPCPDARARGGFLGLTLRHTRGHLVRALLEGVVFDLRHSLECFKELGLPLEELRIGEGGSHSGLWRQIQADVFGRDAVRIATDDLSAVGAALLAGVGTGLFPDFETACGLAVRLGETVRCDAERAAFYQEAYQRYSELYPALREWYARG